MSQEDKSSNTGDNNHFFLSLQSLTFKQNKFQVKISLSYFLYECLSFKPDN